VTPPISGQAAPEVKMPDKEKPAVETKPKDPSRLPPTVKRVLETPGQPVDPSVRTSMEGRFGRSFRDVRIHTDSLAAQSAREVYAHAYTVGQHIVFDSGQYRPETPEGRQLLAHELAHTVQQHGLQRFSDDLLASDGSSEYQHLEREAESVSRAVMRSAEPRSLLSPTRASQPLISRAKNDSPTATGQDLSPGPKDDTDWVDVDASSELAAKGVKQISRPAKDVGLNMVAVRMKDKFQVPAEKGTNALPIWDARAQAGALEAIMQPGSDQPSTATALKQKRPGSNILRRKWLTKMGWNEDSANELWKASAKQALGAPDKKAKFSIASPGPQLTATGCDVDHILELQFGGNNDPNNMQMLDSSPNRSSGAQIAQFLKTTAFTLRGALQKDYGQKEARKSIRIHYDAVELSPNKVDCTCCLVETAGTKLALDAAQKGGTQGTPYPMKSGGFSSCVIVTDESADKITLTGSPFPENAGVGMLVPGLLLMLWKRPGKGGKPQETCPPKDAPKKDDTEAKAGDSPSSAATGSAAAAKGGSSGKGKNKDGGEISATLDPDSRILKTLQLKKGHTVTLFRDPAGNLTLDDKDPKLAFSLGYLSDGVIHKLNVESDGSLSGSGEIYPSFPFLPKTIGVSFDKDKFALSSKIPKDKLRLPFKGIEITDASIKLQIAPEFKAEGNVSFLVSNGSKKLLHGDIKVSANENGLVATGDVFASIPGVDEAKGSLMLKNKEWSGKVEISASQFQGKLKYVKSGNVTILFSSKGMEGDGTVALAIPGLKEDVQAGVSYHPSTGWVFTGKAIFHPPRLKPVEITLKYQDDHLTGTGKTGIEFPHLDGDIDVTYYDGRFSGKGTLAIKTDRATGSITVAMKHNEKGDAVFSGEGKVSYRITENLIASAGIEIDEHEKVRFKGALEFPKPIPLFEGFHGDYTFFEVSISIPIPGASIAGYGLKAVISGSLSAGYAIGPFELQHTKAEANFNPLEKDPEFSMTLTSRLHAGGNVHVTGSITGDLGIDILVASIMGGLTLTATAQLDASMDVPFNASYSKGKIQASVGFDANMALAILLALTAHVRAEAGVWKFKVSTEKVWDLKKYRYDPGLSFGMHLKNPIRYATGEGLTLPSLSDFEWVKPKLSASDALNKTFDQQRPLENEV
jgi:hypothetical protein